MTGTAGLCVCVPHTCAPPAAARGHHQPGVTTGSSMRLTPHAGLGGASSRHPATVSASRPTGKSRTHRSPWVGLSAQPRDRPAHRRDSESTAGQRSWRGRSRSQRSQRARQVTESEEQAPALLRLEGPPGAAPPGHVHAGEWRPRSWPQSHSRGGLASEGPGRPRRSENSEAMEDVLLTWPCSGCKLWASAEPARPPASGCSCQTAAPSPGPKPVSSETDKPSVKLPTNSPRLRIRV